MLEMFFVFKEPGFTIIRDAILFYAAIIFTKQMQNT